MDEATKGIVIGLKRALDAMQRCDGDLEFAVFMVKKDIQAFEDNEDEE